METKTKKNVQVVEDPTLLEDEKTFNRNKWLFTTSGIGRDALYTLVSTYFLQYIQFGLQLNLAQFSVLTILIGVVGRIWDGINDPMMGALVEGAHMKWGKFKPWIFIGAVIDSLLTVVLFNLGRDWANPAQGWLYVVVICLVYLLWEAAFTMNDIGYWSMIPSLSRNKERRDKISTLTVFFAGIGTIAMTGLVTLLSPGGQLECYTLCSIIACVMVIGMQTYTAFGVKEGPREDQEAVEKGEKSDMSLKKMVQTIVSNKQLLWISLAHLCNSIVTGILLGLIYNFYYLENGYDGDAFYFVVCYAIINTVLQLFYPQIAKKMKRKQIQLMSYFIMAAGFIGMALLGWWKEGTFMDTIFKFDIVRLCIFGVLIFAGNTLFYTADIINFNNCVEYNEYVTGERSEAVVTTMRPLIVKFADAVKYLVVLIVLAISGLYGYSKNISSMEAQISRVSGYTVVDEGNKNINKYATEYNIFKFVYRDYINSLTEKEKKDTDAITKHFEAYFKEHKDDYEALIYAQFNAVYTEQIGDLFVKYSYTEDNTEKYGYIRLEDFNVITSTALELLYTDKDTHLTYSLSMTGEENGEVANVGNEWFKDKAEEDGNIARIVVRIFFCGIPLILQTASLVIQRRKFIVDEEYYDKITKEIAKRNKKA